MSTLKLLGWFEDSWTLRLKHLTERVVVFVCDAILFHEIVVVEAARCVHGEASAISHSKSLRHFIITSEINLSIGDGSFP